jgi:hypothetical protein
MYIRDTEKRKFEKELISEPNEAHKQCLTTKQVESSEMLLPRNNLSSSRCHFQSHIENFRAEKVTKLGMLTLCYFPQISSQKEGRTGCRLLNFLDNL